MSHVTAPAEPSDHDAPSGADGVVDEPDWTRDDPADLVPWTLVRTGNAVGRVFWERLGAVGLRPHLFGILVQLQRDPGISSAELARRVLVTPQSMSELLRGLIEDGLVERSGGDRRGQAHALELTAAGRAALRRAAPVIADLDRPDTLGLTATELAELNRLLGRVLDALGAGPHRFPQ